MPPISDALDRALAAHFTRPLPKSAAAQMRVVLRAHKGSTAAVAGALGISRRTVQRYLSGATKRPNPAIAERLAAETARHWQPRIRARAIARAAAQGLAVETRARFGFASAAGSTDDPRMRRITQHLPPQTARALLEARTAGADERTLENQVAAGLQDVYFRDGGRRAHDLVVEFTGIDYVLFDLPE